MCGRFSFVFSVLAGALGAAATGAAGDWETAAPPGVRLNELQLVGTHNSYHLEPAPVEKAWRTSAWVREQAPTLAALAVEYRHGPLTEQLEHLAVRQLELDLHPAGPDGEFPVQHVPVFDERSTVPTLAAALREIRAWSRAHARHVPVIVQLELKSPRLLVPPAGALVDSVFRARWTALPPQREWDDGQFVALEAAIRTVFADEELLTPDLVRGDAPTLREAILERGWPRLDAVRGRVMFCLDNEGGLRDRYLGAAGDGCGRLLFVSMRPEHPAAAWMKLNDPVKDFARIQTLVRQGFLVRTRADEELREAKANDPTRRERAFASGAQIVSTDFPEPDPRYSTYAVRLAGGAAARANPVTARTTR